MICASVKNGEEKKGSCYSIHDDTELEGPQSKRRLTLFYVLDEGWSSVNQVPCSMKRNRCSSQFWLCIKSLNFPVELWILPKSFIRPNCKRKLPRWMDGQRRDRASEEHGRIEQVTLTSANKTTITPTQSPQRFCINCLCVLTCALWWISDTPTSLCSTHIQVHPLLHSVNEMTRKTPGR